MRVKVDWRSCSKECYENFCKEHPNVKIGYRQWADIIYAYNYAFRDYLLETGFKAKMPWGIGEFAISKKKRRSKYVRKDGSEFLILPVDWKKTKAKGKIVYNLNLHTDGYGFKWKWFLSKARFKYSEIWYFKPSRISSRLVTHYVQQEEYRNKYQEWEKCPIPDHVFKIKKNELLL